MGSVEKGSWGGKAREVLGLVVYISGARNRPGKPLLMNFTRPVGRLPRGKLRACGGASPQARLFPGS